MTSPDNDHQAAAPEGSEPAGADDIVLTTDDEAQQDDSVIQPESS